MAQSPDQLGTLVLNDEGAVLSSSGDLENDERSANIFMGLISLTSSVDPVAFPEGKFKKLSLVYDNHCYIICLSNRKIHVLKKRISAGNTTTTTTTGEYNSGVSIGLQ